MLLDVSWIKQSIHVDTKRDLQFKANINTCTKNRSTYLYYCCKSYFSVFLKKNLYVLMYNDLETNEFRKFRNNYAQLIGLAMDSLDLTIIWSSVWLYIVMEVHDSFVRCIVRIYVTFEKLLLLFYCCKNYWLFVTLRLRASRSKQSLWSFFSRSTAQKL